jgi:hypothetical protein
LSRETIANLQKSLALERARVAGAMLRGVGSARREPGHPILTSQASRRATGFSHLRPIAKRLRTMTLKHVPQRLKTSMAPSRGARPRLPTLGVIGFEQKEGTRIDTNHTNLHE